MDIPVLFLIFNRPDTTQKVFSAIRNVKPSKLYVAADGPRKGNEADSVLCRQTRDIISQVDWDCEVITLFREENSGCRNAVSSAITWFFSREEMGIILEDDCLPHPSFFTFCGVMLDRYKNDKRIHHIGGANFQRGAVQGNGDYYYSHLTHVWGWASWRRVWNLYDVNMALWEKFKNINYLQYLFPGKNISRYLNFVFEETYKGNINTWDYQLFFSNLINGGLSVIPNVNLISNIGFGPGSTHTSKPNANANMPAMEISSFNAPEFFIPSFEADIFTLQKSFTLRDLVVLNVKATLKQQLGKVKKHNT